MSAAPHTQANQTTTTRTPLVRELELTAEDLLRALLNVPAAYRLSVLDSGGSAMHGGWAGGRFLLAGIDPFEIVETHGALMRIARRDDDRIIVRHENALQLLDERLCEFRQRQGFIEPAPLPFGGGACIATFAYDYARRIKLLRAVSATSRAAPFDSSSDFVAEPDAVLAFYDSLIVHDYVRARTYVTSIGGAQRLEIICEIVCEAARTAHIKNSPRSAHESAPTVFSEANNSMCANAIKVSSEQESADVVSHVATSNFTRNAYLKAVSRIKEHIVAGDIYQANFTQQFTVLLTNESFTPEHVFLRLRRDHPAAFTAFVRRADDTCISISPERFLRVSPDESVRRIEAWPIKGTRPRGATMKDDLRLRRELLASEKDRAENVMIVDLLRNDLGRVCEYGSIEVTDLCALEEHPTLFHLVSKVRGRLRGDVTAGEIMRAAFPCGSITGAPKIRAMQIIDETETARRGLSMGAIGCFSFDGAIDSSVAIRTMTVRNRVARFNVGGGIVADSRAESEYDESLVKAQALLAALDAKIKVTGIT